MPQPGLARRPCQELGAACSATMLSARVCAELLRQAVLACLQLPANLPKQGCSAMMDAHKHACKDICT